MTIVDVSVTQDDQDVHVVVNGEIDLTNRDAVADRLNAAITNQTTSVVIDLEAVSYLDSSGLRLFFTLAERLRVLQVDLALLVSEASLSRRIIALSGLDQLVEVRDAHAP
jgi:stage II sporulation protein AA (anti-sigma F factor antagonist)